MTPSRVVEQAEALAWLQAKGVLEGCSFITSLPDFTEFPQFTIEEWKKWFQSAAERVLASCPEEGVTIFYQRDSKHEGLWVDKGFLCLKAAEAAGQHLLWHKIICRAPPGQITFGKPAYSHLLCFSKGVRTELTHSTPDVLPLAGQTTWTRGMGVRACELACRFVLERTSTRTVVDPFCGHGTVLAIANELGLHAHGVELSRKRAEKSRDLQMRLED